MDPLSPRWRVALLVAAVLGVALAGFLAGSARLAAIDAGAFAWEEGARVELRGFVAAPARRRDGRVRARLSTADGRLELHAREPVPDLPVGAEVEARGTVAEPDPWLRDNLLVHGIRRVVVAGRVRLTGRRRGGLAGALDGVRGRAEEALERGMRAPEGALARGFVLGQDDRIDPRTAEDFRRSGLSHLLAVSGQNVMLLSALGVAIMALLGIPLRARLWCLLALIAIYVPVAGAGPSIQRAGVMGAAGVVAALASRPRSRAYAILLAALATLLINPRATMDVGWQMSFAAVAGIALTSRGLASLALRLLGGDRRAGALDWRRALSEGAAITAAATIATAPLIAHHFDGLPLASLPANLLALPAVAPVMWLGMLAGFAGQLPAIPVEPLNAVNALLIAYIEQVARWLGEPGWSLLPIAAPGRLSIAAVYAAVVVGVALVARLAARRAGLRLGAPPGRGPGRGRRPARAVALAACVAALVALAALPGGDPGAAGGAGTEDGTPRLEIAVLDIGQGDAILLDPPRTDPVLVDGGPPGGALAEQLRREGVERLAAVAVTHEDIDHSGGVVELLGRRPVGVVLHGDPLEETGAAAIAAGVPARRIAAGDTVRFGRLRFEVLWPPAGVPSPGTDRNTRSLVLLARWRGFSMLLTGDAEAESVPLSPGPVDVLKVAHHGSADAGLAPLLERSFPRLALISAGRDNGYGHPTAGTLAALAEAGVPVMRTDLHGTVGVSVGADGWTAGPR